MATPNIPLVNTANTFAQWLFMDNNVANSVNELRQGNYSKDNGTFTVANGTFFASGPGTAVSVTNNVLVQNVTTTNVLVVTGSATIAGNVSLPGNVIIGGTLNAYSILLDSTNTYSIINGNAIVNNLTVKGTQTLVGNTLTSSNSFILRGNVATAGNGYIIIEQGTTNGNAVIQFTVPANVWQITANATNVALLQTILTNANITDTWSSTAANNAASANIANGLYAIATAAYAKANSAAAGSGGSANVYSNAGVVFIAAPNLTFNNTATANALVTSNGLFGANIAYVVNTAVDFAAGANATAQSAYSKANTGSGSGAANVYANAGLVFSSAPNINSMLK